MTRARMKTKQHHRVMCKIIIFGISLVWFTVALKFIIIDQMLSDHAEFSDDEILRDMKPKDLLGMDLTLNGLKIEAAEKKFSEHNNRDGNNIDSNNSEDIILTNQSLNNTRQQPRQGERFWQHQQLRQQQRDKQARDLRLLLLLHPDPDVRLPQSLHQHKPLGHERNLYFRHYNQNGEEQVNENVNTKSRIEKSSIIKVTQRVTKGNIISVGERDERFDWEPLAAVDAPGEFGLRVPFDPNTLALDDQRKYNDGLENNGFNQFVSDKISLRRRLPDSRPHDCKKITYTGNLPETSIIICFYNEAWSTLLRTVYSVLDRSPGTLVREIILVDDFSTMDHLKEPLDNYIQRFPKVKILRAKRRLGLVGARLLGYSVATAPVITFLDSHVECFPGWLEPMLSRISQNSMIVTYPELEGINTMDFSVFLVDTMWHGLFFWFDLSYYPSPLPREKLRRRKSETQPMESPTMPGGIFSINREFFTKLGAYDPGMNIWGGENMELSFKVWMCNGTIERLPCSQVAHVFRTRNPYLANKDASRIVRPNTARVAEVWMDDYKKYLFHFFNNIKPNIGDVSKRKFLRRQLKCRTFDWYLKHVATSLHIPTDSIAIGEVRNIGLKDMCLDVEKERTGTCRECNGLGMRQIWYFTRMGRLKTEVRDVQHSWVCWTVQKGEITLTPCSESDLQQVWIHTAPKTLQNVLTKSCLGVSNNRVTLETCSDSKFLKWTLVYRAPSEL